MYVAELDRSWLHTSFSGKGLLVTRAEQIAELGRTCDYVYVDPERSEAGLLAAHRPQAGHAPDGSDAKDFDSARRALDETIRRLSIVVHDARRFGRVEIAPLNRCARNLVNVTLACPDAALWLIRLDSGHGLLYRRSVGTAVAGIMFGRQLGLDSAELAQLAVGGLLLDIGKTAVPISLLAKPGRLNATEMAFVHRHVQQGFALLRVEQDVPRRVVEMVFGHHERIDGGGYPRRLRGTDIPLFARIAAIIDTFDALTVDRHYAGAISGHAALRYLNSKRGEAYDAALVGEFIDAIGLYPTGTRVEMSDGSSGLVCAQNSDWPLRPQVLVTTDMHGHKLDEPRLLTNGIDGHIARALPPRRNGVDHHALEIAITHGR